MALFTMASLLTESNSKVGSCDAVTDLLIKENSKMMFFMVMEFISGKTLENMLANGRIMKCMGTVCSPGLTEESTMEAILLEKSMGLELTNGVINVNILDIGRMANSMDKE